MLHKYLLLLGYISFLACTTCPAQSSPQITLPAVKGAVAASRNSDDKVKVRESDTSKENKEPRYFYLSASANIMVNTVGDFSKRFAPVIEFGRTYGIFDIGLAVGALNVQSMGEDTSHYFEFRPTINVFSKGRFAEALCLGVGFVPKARDGFMTEICNSINFNISELVAVAVLQGYYFFDGATSNRTAQYFSLGFTYNFLRDHSVNKKRKRDAIISDK